MATIAFAEDAFAQTMIDMAAALSHRGHRTVRLLADPPGEVSKPWRGRWEGLADRSVASAVDPSGALTAAGVVALMEERPADVQAMEPIAIWASEKAFGEPRWFRKAAALPDHEVIDKFSLASFLRTTDVAAPATWNSFREVPPSEAGPFLFKARGSGGGDGVRRCDSRAELGATAALFGHRPYIVQQFVTGPPIDAAGIAKDGEIIQAVTYVNEVDPANPYAYAYSITVTDDPALLDCVRRTVQVLGLSGPFAIDAMRDRDGRVLVVDVNLRIWGCWTACQDAGLDVIGSYEFALGLGPRPAPPVLDVGSRWPLLRTPPLAVTSDASRASWLAHEMTTIRRRSHWLGRRWAALAAREATAWAVRGHLLHPAPPLVVRGDR